MSKKPSKKKNNEEDIDPKRARKGRREITMREKKRKKLEKGDMIIHEDVAKFVETEAKKTGKTAIEVLDTLFEYGFAVVEFDETQGKASLIYNSWSSPMPAIPESDRYSQKILKEFRRLRENFPPVAAGVEWHRDFTSGGGFIVQIDDPKDKHQEKVKGITEDLCADVYQDQYTIGLDNILDIMMDMALTDGCSAAEIVYGKEVSFEEYVESFEEVTMPDTGKMAYVMVPKEPKWKSTNDKVDDGLGGVTRLKIIEEAASRLRPYRHPLSGEILYWTLDEKGKSEHVKQGWGTQNALNQQRKTLKFHPWEILWLSWNQRGVNLKGMSIIQPVYTIARFVEAIQKAIGIGFRRWANKKYFFVCGTEKRPWTKPHINQFLKALEKMVKNNWIGIPVPQGFKVEEMGGEESIFEGKNLLDYLTGMICAGMQFPREFLEIGKSGTSEKAWLAWTVRYGRNQQQVRRAIENQLWTRHLWCKLGKEYRVKKKGVKPADQEMRPTYIPKLQWRAEGRWHRERKTELLSGLLNVANPVDAPLKMSIQREISAVLGFGEVDWDVIQEIFTTQSEIRLLEAKMEKLKAQANLEVTQEEAKSGELKKSIKTKREMAAQPPQTPEEQLRLQAEKRALGGVSRTTRGEKATAPEKGKAKEQGGTRQPKRVVEETLKTERMKQKKLELEMETEKAKLETFKKKEKKLLEIMETAEQDRKNREQKEFKLREETEGLTQDKLQSEIDKNKISMGTIPFKGLLPKGVAEKLAKSFEETEVARREKILTEKTLMEKREEERKAKEKKNEEERKTREEKLEGERKAEEEKIEQQRTERETKRLKKVELEETERKVREENESKTRIETQRLMQEKIKLETDQLKKIRLEETERKAKERKLEEERKVKEEELEEERKAKAEKLEGDRIKSETKRLKKVELEETERKVREEETAEMLRKTEELKQDELRARISKAKAEEERIKSLSTDIGLLPKSKADEISEQILETEKLKQEQVKMETKKAKAEYERQQKKIKLLDELEERMKKKKKRQKTK